MPRILSSLLIVLVLLAIAALIFARAPHLAPLPETTATSTGAAQMTMQAIHEDTAVYTINAKYPQFGIPAVDTAIKADLDQALTEFRAYPANPPDSAVAKNEFNSDVGAAYVGPDLVSVSLEISEYTGGAHPNTVYDGINVDLTSGKRLTLDDALSLIGQTLQQVASSSEAQLKPALGDAMFEEGFAPTPDDYATFLIDKDHVTFIFQNYQVAPYAAGPQQAVFKRVK